MNDINYFNYFLTSKNSKLTNGHLKASDLNKKILNHDGNTAYSCYFDLDFSKLKLEWDTGKSDKEGKKIYEYTLDDQRPSNEEFTCNGKTFTKYEGIAKPALDCISFDFDAEDNPQESMYDVKRFVEWIGVEDLAVFFSGSKGFHVMIPFNYFPLTPNEHLPNQLKDLAKYLKEFYPTLDDSIYNYNRKFRVPFTKHEKSGLYKILVPLNLLNDEDINIEDIKQAAGELDLSEIKKDFIKEMNPTLERETLQVFKDAIEASARKSYQIEKERAGTIDKPSPFEKFDGKLCIKKMLESTCDDVGRNNAAMRIVNDYYRTGKPQDKCEQDLMEWASKNGLPISELTTIINNIYERGANYNFGCQDEAKSIYCSGQCPIWIRLDPEKRPIVIDPPKNASTEGASDFAASKWLMEKIFHCTFDEKTNGFKDGMIVKQDAKNLFYYKDDHWQFLDESKIHILKTKVNANFGNKLSSRKLDGIFKMFIMYVPEKPDDVDMFSPKNNMANFLDGTLHLERSNNKFSLVFKEHDKLNFCTTMIELNYKSYSSVPTRKNEMFEDWLHSFLGESEDAVKLIQEMFGASLMPKFPQFFMLLGKSGTGKSTTIKVLKRLHKNEKNISGVSPDNFNGFDMTSMVGKLMNIVGDIKTNCRIDDDIVKQVDDQENVRIRVKNTDDIYTKLPALHIFGANKMPSTDEGYSGAMKRRFSIVNFDKQFTGKKNTEIANDMFDHDPQGILAFALRGLERLVVDNSGEYTKTKKSQENVENWSKKNDAIWGFLNDMCEEGSDVDGKAVIFELEESGKIKRSIVWQAFAKWQEVNLNIRQQLGKMEFLNMLNDSGFGARKYQGDFVVRGINVKNGENDEI